MTTPEGAVKRDIKDYLGSIGAYYFMPVQTGYGARTIDFLGCVGGKFIGIEAKRPGRGNPSPLQKITIENIRTAGGLAFVATSAEEVAGALKALLAGQFNANSA